MFPKKSPLQDFIKSTLVFAFRREFRRTFEQQSAPNKVVIWHRTKSIMGHFFFNFFNPFRYDFVHPSWCDFSFGSSTCTAKEQTIGNHFKNTFEVLIMYFFLHQVCITITYLPNLKLICNWCTQISSPKNKLMHLQKLHFPLKWR